MDQLNRRTEAQRKRGPTISKYHECTTTNRYIFHVEISNVPLGTCSFNKLLGILYDKGHVTFEFENITTTPINKRAVHFFSTFFSIFVKFLISFLAESAMLMHHE
jgi:ABC-type phosphate/phosphonate transport system permease subunit